jgi:tetratricopeptide (TPR) repeat protein
LQPKNVRYLNNAGEIALYNKEFSAAESTFRKAVEVDPGYFFARVNIIRLKYIQGNYRDALIESNNILDQDPNFFTALCWKTRLLLVENRREEAEKVLQHLKKVPHIENYEAEIFEAMSWHFYLGDLEKASAILSGVLAKDLPILLRKEYYLLYIPVRILLGDHTSWMPELERLVQIEGSTWIEGMLRMMAGEVSREEMRLRAINKQWLLSYYTVSGVLFEMEGKIEEAQDAYRRAIESVHVEQYDWLIAYDGVRRFEGMQSRITGALFTPLRVVGLRAPGLGGARPAQPPMSSPRPTPPPPRPAPRAPDPGMNP